MNVLQQYPGQSEPRGPALRTATSATALLFRESGKQVRSPNRTPLSSSGQSRLIIQQLLLVSATRDLEGLLFPFLEEREQIDEVSTPSAASSGPLYFPWNAPHQETGQDSELSAVEQTYVLEDRSAIAAFIKRNRLLDLLLEAREPLISAFGESPVKKLTLVEDDEGFTSLFCLVLIPGSLDEAKRALDSFDDGWWLAQSHEAAGKLNFDVELI